MHPIINIALTAARKAGNIMIRSWQRLDTIHPTAKGAKDFVTDVDKAAELAIIEVIQKAHPHHQIIAEETGQQGKTSDNIWYIDPLDGTYNYLHGLPHFCVSIAFESKGILEHGLIFDPIRHEVFNASRGQGAYLNNRRIRVSAQKKFADALIATGFPIRTPQKLTDYLPIFQRLMTTVTDSRCLGSAALDLAYVAAGRVDGYLETDLKPWDLGAGALLVKEAGGFVTDWQEKDLFLKTGDILATTPGIFQDLLQLIHAQH
ncbi:MAG: inositol monophosphatase family protein [Gammaproteobacteria bacterium]